MTIALQPPTGRKVTPTGRLILPADADRDTWLNARRQGLGSSDIAAILGISRFGNALSVYYDKTGGLPLESDDSEPALWGRLNEETVAREWARRNRSVVRRVGLVANIDRPWQMCTLDRRVLECPLADGGERCAVEIKCRDKMKAPTWRTGCPDDILAQTLWQADVCGYDHIHVAVLIGGNDYRQFVVRTGDHQQLIADLRTAGANAWQQITQRTPPALAGDADPDVLLALYEQLHPHRDGGFVQIAREEQAHDDLTEYVQAADDETDARKRKTAAKARLVARLGNAEQALDGDRIAYTYEPASREHVDVSRLRAEFPDAYAACVEDRTHRRLNIPTAIRKRYAA
ncbi:hypothetical protein D7231_32050 [Streptomyces klenkii]|uniref:YqaJ viral recombinase domain-containing protein n=1 Tax=Streptomyces klenkii TaxID=1420899 RepID=A0A3B0AM17_9ACTN|nr:YqaJ viral recombinase family protein [Streptomyces klenkii]RKN61905.1 hypothetical protein D7231_32050 [Streptomyces klenkii]